MNKKIVQKVKKRAEIQEKNEVSSTKKTLLVIEQVHHSYAPQASTKEDFDSFTKQVNDLQKAIFDILTDLDECGLDLLGIEDISYKDEEEIDASEAAEMVKHARKGTISTWHYEINFPKHYKTYCPDIINIGGMRKAVAFTAAKLLGKAEALEKQKKYFIDFFTQNLLNLTTDEKNSLWDHVLAYKKEHPGISETSLFLSLVVNSQVQGFIEGLGEYYGSSAITAYLKEHLREDFSEKPDSTKQFLKIVQDQFTNLVLEIFKEAEKKADFELMCSTFMKFMKQVFDEAISATKDIETLLNEERSKVVVENCLEIMEENKKDHMVIVFGAAHSESLLKKCKKEGINCLIIRPNHKLWQQIEI